MDKITLNRRRGNLKGQLTRLKTFLDNELTTADNVVIESKLESVLHLKTKLEALKDDYYVCLKDDEVPDMENIFTQLELEAENIQVSLKRFLVHSSNKDVNNKNTNKDESKLEFVKSNIRLPEIHLPSFSGKYSDWNLFKEQFVSLIESNSSLNDSQKLYYLRSSLVEKASCIQSVEDTYDSLMKALVDRYENKRLIVFSHINALLTLDKVKIESAKDLRSLVDEILKNLRALKQMNLILNPLTEVLLISIISGKIDPETRKEYEMTVSSVEVPTWNDFIDFLQKRCQILENLHSKETHTKPKVLSKPKNFLVNAKPLLNCVLCKRDHRIFNCPEFLGMDQKKRFEVVKKHSLCINCLGFHKISSCTSKYKCRFCRLKHSSLLHIEKKSNAQIPPKTQTPVPLSEAPVEENQGNKTTDEQLICANARILSGNESGILPTAIVYVKNADGCFVKCRSIFDSGSTHNYMTIDCYNRLNVNKQTVNAFVNGLNNSRIAIKSKVEVNISNGKGNFVKTTEMFIVPKITGLLPSRKIDISSCDFPLNVNYADPSFAKPGKIDMLLGAGIFFDLLRSHKIVLENGGHIILQDTELGYIVSGTINENSSNSYCGLITEAEHLNDTLKCFWEVESFPEIETIKGKEERLCEENFINTYSRKDGRFIVQMPLKKDPSCLGKSRAIAENKLNSMWNRLVKNPDILTLYRSFLNEYLEMGHMEQVKEEIEPEITYYLPHQFVYRPESSSTPLRVVFNASQPTSSGESLNSLQYVGGVIQDDLFSILLRFRKNKYAFITDIQKMFRTIAIHESQRDLLRILWKNGIHEPIVTYRLTTVTYGTTSAPFLATRTLKQLAIEEGAEFPLAASVIHSDVYVDDIVSGSQDLETAKSTQHQLISMLEKAGMKLHKWTSNSVDLINSSTQTDQELHLTFDKNSLVKTLGLNWNAREDQFLFKVDVKESLEYTKRDVLSVIARLYDPLGLIGPVTCKAKIFLQKLWLQKVTWEDAIMPELTNEWQHYLTSLKAIEDLRIPRWILSDNPQQIILHCFADASEKAYGAVIYIQCIYQDSTASSMLVTSKSRVAPIKTISIPRLELCSCLLVSKLMRKVKDALKLSFDSIILYTDSSISLAWIKTPSYQLKSFVANRVTKIQDLTENCIWKHVPSKLNPADILSRGAYPADLSSSDLWWHGPTFLQEPTEVQEQAKIESNNFEHDASYRSEFKAQKPVVNLVTVKETEPLNIINNCSSYTKLLRIIAWCLRFVKNAKQPSNRNRGCLTSAELDQSLICIVKNIQTTSFAEELKCLEKKRLLPNTSNLLSLSPFLDSQGILRVGGRLKNSSLLIDQKHQILIPSQHNLANLIINHFHVLYFHAGQETTLYLIRTKFWIIRCRSSVRKLIKNCITCTRVSTLGTRQMMADLPTARVTSNLRAFVKVGVDYCGPFIIKEGLGKSRKTRKCYCSLFICFSVKAIHIEIVSNLSTDAFIAAFRRFVARRGKPSDMYSDNGSNFLGANNEMRKILKSLFVPDNKEKFENYLATEGIRWHFNPPAAPHFGGLWEAGVKSLKSHLKKVVGNTILTFEEFFTVVTQIEAVLNSRPLCPLSNDPNDISVLTPGHFLTGSSLVALPDLDYMETPMNRLNRWQLVQKLTQIFWKKWSSEYLSRLQQRPKWCKGNIKFNVGDIVLVKNESLSSLNWNLARILQIHPGKDGTIRVVTLKTQKGIFKRPVTKIASLPFVN